jgi:hypothetical protein
MFREMGMDYWLGKAEEVLAAISKMYIEVIDLLLTSHKLQVSMAFSKLFGNGS